MSDQSFRYISPELRVYQGDTVFANLRTELNRAGCRRAFLIHSRSIGESAAFGRLRHELGDLLCGASAAVKAGSPVDSVMTMAEHLREASADGVIAIGGGSAIVTARAASVVLAEGQHPEVLSTKRAPDGTLTSPRLRAHKLPQFVIPTVPTTAIARAGSALHEPSTRRRLALFDPQTRARAIFVHPELLATAPAALVFNAALHAFCSGIETLESPAIDPYSEAWLLHGTRLLSAQLRAMKAGRKAPDRAALVTGAILTGRGADATGGGLLSALTHAICSRFDEPNGWVAATLLPDCMRFNEAFTVSRSDAMHAVLSPDTTNGDARRPADLAEQFLDRLGVSDRPRIAQMNEEQIREVADLALIDWFSKINPRPVNEPAPVIELLHNLMGRQS
ncbi:iron-containing alcohol dehydrogenase family protein [Caballeronia sp. LZ035]|uniref:iron-containing alcohol dehydrogenase family protein n=1 Tax=Caballeronia sp. LZ035 TaxID=3038568 RepID=UPI00285D3FB4|nr:iron-containing alcohol dehydrogenase family protein [Caballeronia sp. LZ035]MDR5760564.1 iron-containing alcohol dehydrogenase family protein [Caballeronia sp. LZ035]